jgi:hypothetical protein
MKGPSTNSRSMVEKSKSIKPYDERGRLVVGHRFRGSCPALERLLYFKTEEEKERKRKGLLRADCIAHCREPGHHRLTVRSLYGLSESLMKPISFN